MNKIKLVRNNKDEVKVYDNKSVVTFGNIEPLEVLDKLLMILKDKKAINIKSEVKNKGNTIFIYYDL